MKNINLTVITHPSGQIIATAVDTSEPNKNGHQTGIIPSKNHIIHKIHAPEKILKLKSVQQFHLAVSDLLKQYSTKR